MRFLLDSSPNSVATKSASPYVGGQLLTPLTNYRWWGGTFAIDNGAFARFDRDAFRRLLDRMSSCKTECLFVACPDVVGSARRTCEIFRYRNRLIGMGWPIALVAQDGIEDLEIPWSDMKAVFIGGGDPWKDSKAAADVVRSAKILGIHVHVGRVNSPKRYRAFAELGADTCDGNGVGRYDHMLSSIVHEMQQRLLFTETQHDQVSGCENGSSDICNAT